ncbi:MAG TPA: pyridoxal-phosphate dependent enzyme [bacterium]|nr:pyridoxal-phosphate dependent enzyme [bacterium]
MSRSPIVATLDRLPRFPLAVLPTPLEHAANLSRALDIQLWIKRDDLTGLALGGNKVRKIEYLVGDALAEGATSLLTTAAAQSNFCRVAAAAGARAGLRVGLLLRGTGTEPIQGNLLLDHLLGAEIRFTDQMDPYAEGTRRRLDAWVEEERARGERPYLIYLHGGSHAGALAAAAYVQAAVELDAQCRAGGIHPDHLYVAVGSGSTLAGLLVGARGPAEGLASTCITGVCVGALSDVVDTKVREFARAAAALLGAPVPNEPLRLDDGERGDAYGVPTAAALAAIRTAAMSEALIFNPVYTGKAFAALLRDVAQGTVAPGSTVVFINTGGDPLIFANAAHLAGPLGQAHRAGTAQ